MLKGTSKQKKNGYSELDKDCHFFKIICRFKDPLHLFYIWFSTITFLNILNSNTFCLANTGLVNTGTFSFLSWPRSPLDSYQYLWYQMMTAHLYMVYDMYTQWYNVCYFQKGFLNRISQFPGVHMVKKNFLVSRYLYHKTKQEWKRGGGPQRRVPLIRPPPIGASNHETRAAFFSWLPAWRGIQMQISCHFLLLTNIISDH